jgi:hypothetical protein
MRRGRREDNEVTDPLVVSINGEVGFEKLLRPEVEPI